MWRDLGQGRRARAIRNKTAARASRRGRRAPRNRVVRRQKPTMGWQRTNSLRLSAGSTPEAAHRGTPRRCQRWPMTTKAGGHRRQQTTNTLSLSLSLSLCSERQLSERKERNRRKEKRNANKQDKKRRRRKRRRIEISRILTFRLEGD